MEQDRRRHQRSNASFLVTCCVREPIEVVIAAGSKESSALMKDIGEGGVAVVVPHDIPSGAVVHLAFTLIDANAHGDDRDRAISAVGCVVNTAPASKGERRLGVLFTYIDDEDRSAIRRYVQAHLSNR